ncbi:hypothetical protein FRB94_008896 [Tulasnella sp. JGI-2019a]|nr:hypothetical protein FRB93_003003 [Tulasnella sp. JGI-2019a]KAG8995640.1 hypothetical protein FRB94_008896 [Tulasnella sp. JGI-2019a]
MSQSISLAESEYNAAMILVGFASSARVDPLPVHKALAQPHNPSIHHPSLARMSSELLVATSTSHRDHASRLGTSQMNHTYSSYAPGPVQAGRMARPHQPIDGGLLSSTSTLAADEFSPPTFSSRRLDVHDKILEPVPPIGRLGDRPEVGASLIKTATGPQRDRTNISRQKTRTMAAPYSKGDRASHKQRLHPKSATSKSAGHQDASPSSSLSTTVMKLAKVSTIPPHLHPDINITSSTRKTWTKEAKAVVSLAVQECLDAWNLNPWDKRNFKQLTDSLIEEVYIRCKQIWHRLHEKDVKEEDRWWFKTFQGLKTYFSKHSFDNLTSTMPTLTDEQREGSIRQQFAYMERIRQAAIEKAEGSSKAQPTAANSSVVMDLEGGNEVESEDSGEMGRPSEN